MHQTRAGSVLLIELAVEPSWKGAELLSLVGKTGKRCLDLADPSPRRNGRKRASPADKRMANLPVQLDMDRPRLDLVALLYCRESVVASVEEYASQWNRQVT